MIIKQTVVVTLANFLQPPKVTPSVENSPEKSNFENPSLESQDKFFDKLNGESSKPKESTKKNTSYRKH